MEGALLVQFNNVNIIVTVATICKGIINLWFLWFYYKNGYTVKRKFLIIFEI